MTKSKLPLQDGPKDTAIRQNYDVRTSYGRVRTIHSVSRIFRGGNRRSGLRIIARWLRSDTFGR